MQTERSLEHVAGQILIAREHVETLTHVRFVDSHFHRAAASRVKAHFFKQLFHHGVQTSRTDIFRSFIHLKGVMRNRLDRFGREGELGAVCTQKCLVLLDDRSVSLSKDALEVFFGKAL